MEESFKQKLDETGIEKKEKKSTAFWKYVGYVALLIGILGSLAEVLNFINIIPSNSRYANTLTVLVHGKKGIDHCILPNRGIVKIAYGDAIVSKQINNECEVTFRQLSDIFFETENKVRIWFEDPEGEPYKTLNPDSSYKLQKEQFLALPIVLAGQEEIHGIVKDFSNSSPIEGVTVRVKGINSISNEYGEFEIIIPESKQSKYVTIRAYKEGYMDYELSNVPTVTDQEIVIALKSEAE